MLDRAGWHTTARLAVPANITLLALPARSPELNPAEMLWRELRQRYLSNRVYRSTTALERAVSRAWCALANQPERVRRLCNFGWLRSACSVSGWACQLARPADTCQDAALGIQRCGSSSSMRLFGWVGSRSSTSLR